MDRLYLRRLNPDNPPGQIALSEPVVVSPAPLAANRGAEIAFHVEAKVAKGQPQVRLETGPKGMQVTPDGRVSWHVPAQWPHAETSVLLSIKDEDNRETFHRFWLLHPGDAPAKPQKDVQLPSLAPARPFPAPRFNGNRLEKKFPQHFQDWVLGGGGRYLILFFIEPKANRLLIFDVSETRELGQIPLPDDANLQNTFFAASNDKVAVIMPQRGTVQRWNLITLQRERVMGLPALAGIKAIALGAAITSAFLQCRIT